MSFIKKHWQLLISILFLTFYIGFWRLSLDVMNTIEIEELKRDGENEKPSDNIKKIDLKLQIQTPNLTKTFEDEIFSNESLWDFIEDLRKSNRLTYEQTEFISGPKITSINGYENKDGWDFYINGNLLEESFDSHKIIDDAIYTLK